MAAFEMRSSQRKNIVGVVGGVGVLGAVVAIMIGVAGGVGTYTFIYADGGSYLTNDPAACANCHVMGGHLDAWSKSSHASVAVCNDCHAPHGSVPAKLAVKAINGFNHSLAFTTGRFHEPLRITDLNRRVTEQACRHCHGSIVDAIDTSVHADESLSCIRCHRDVGHSN